MKKKVTASFLVMALSACLVVSGCSFTSTMSKLGEYLPTGISALNTVLSLLAAGGVISGSAATTVGNDGSIASAALADIVSGVQAYNGAPAADKATKLQAVVTALNAAQATLSKLEADVHAPNQADQLMVNGLLGVIITSLSAFEVNLAPASVSAMKVSRASAAPASLKQFKQQFNAILVKGGHAERQLR